jgi:hypothetical protein
MATTFQEFLRQKAAASDWKERSLNRDLWLGALNQLFNQVREWLREADPDGVLEIVPYQVQRMEERLGIYDAPALKIRLGTESVDVRPVGRFSIGPIFSRTPKDSLSPRGTDQPPKGRVDITDGDRRYMLLRAGGEGPDRWFVMDNDLQETPFDRARLEAILQDLLS